MKRKTKDQPYVENYPPLRDWLRKWDAYCQWQKPLGDPEDPTGYIEQWGIRGHGHFIIIINSNNTGWDLYTPTSSNAVEETFCDAERRLGLTSPPREGS